eukprot:TRINITY_DN2497_c0_g1_i1.p1 TRINITY_DN2497_c0_g1~~TRINITY_DN2497_c0_g1_i1.p1  ORF type:complete len:182 (+),score=39.84 TRINITY_DN2497_c0_g1_i1:88-633(+)
MADFSVTPVKQREDMWCGAACCEIIVNRWAKSNQAIAEAWNKFVDGQHPQEALIKKFCGDADPKSKLAVTDSANILKRILREAGKLDQKKHDDFSKAAEKIVANKGPGAGKAVTFWEEALNKNEIGIVTVTQPVIHQMVVYGYKEDNFLIADPAQGKAGAMPKSTLGTRAGEWILTVPADV